ncbi:DUF418 domain-containing protein [Bacillus sp. JCM 19034]|uniref:DUF418 domain-containing protein n=1 Tax=Bacillus sp. JCM 19034 TaxID=1481928 RepID=UPI0007832B80|nr:DUF418 domain-containing protein [Bacillus sp. JCM 19034]
MNTTRIQMVDAIRGFCLLGILIANMLIFQYGIFGMEELETFSISKWDASFHTFLKIAVEGSFMPIFAFLFGFGLIKMKESLERRQLGVKRTLFRRFLLLIVLGFLHSTFLWEGDILLMYGMMGIFLLLFVKRKAKTILIWALLFFGVTTLIGYGSTLEFTDEQHELNEYIAKETATYSEGTYWEVVEFRNSEDSYQALGLSEEDYLLILLLMPIINATPFLIGMYAAKKDWFSNPENLRSFYKKGMILIPIGLAFKSIYYFINHSLAGMLYEPGAIALAIGYIFLLAYLYTKVSNLAAFNLFGYVGRLSLTNYIMHSIICTTIFYGYGLGLYGKLGVIFGFLLCIVIYVSQMICSKWYLSRFKSGPLEHLARICTYLSLSGRPKVKKESTLKEVG